MPRSGNPGFDEDVERFVVSHLRSVWTLELLLLMRSEPDRVWTEAALTGELRANLAMVGDILQRLQGLDLVAREGEGWRYRPGGPDLDDLCARTEKAYRQKPFAMISLIGRGASSLRDLADAFRFKTNEP